MNRQAATLFGKNMTASGFSRDDFVFIPQVRCPHDVDQYTTKEVKSIRDHCRPYLTEYIDAVQPEAVLPLGNNAARQVMGKAVKITNVRGIAERSAELGTVIFPLLSPGMVLMYPQHSATFETDCKTLYELSEVSYNLSVRAKSQLGKYTIIDDLQFLIDMEPRVLFFDTENTGLSHFQKGTDDVRTYDPDIHDKRFSPSAAVLTMQFCVKPGEAYMLVWDHPEQPASPRAKRKLREQLRTLLNNPRTLVVGQNAKYDRVYVEANVGVRYPIGGDTLMLACLIDENSIAKGQDMLVRQYVPEMAGYADHFNATTDKSRMWEVPLPKLIDYGCGDVDSGLRLYRALRSIVYADKKLKAHYRRVSIPGLNAFSLIEQRGMMVDEEALDAFEQVMDEEVTKQYNSLISQVPRSIKRKHIDIVTEKKGKVADALKFSRADFTRDILFYHKDGFRLKPKVFTPKTAKLSPDKRIASTSSKDHLPYFYDDCPFTYELSEYVKNERLLNTNIRGFKKKYIVDGLVRPTYSLAKTVTGRTSCVRADTPVVTFRGLVRADSIRVGDMVFTHTQRWMPVTALFRKDPALMYEVYLSNGEVLPVTAHHRVMLESGVWADIGYILEGLGYAISKQATDAGQVTGTSCSYDVQAGVGDSGGGGGAFWDQPSNGEGYDPCVYTGRSIHYAEGYEIQAVKVRGEESAVWEKMGFRLRGWEGVSNPPTRRYEILRTPHSHGGVSGTTSVSVTGLGEHPPHRRKSEEQRYFQSLSSDTGRASGNTRQISDYGGGLTIEKVICAGVHRVYDFEVAEDHSYLACGVFNHNSEDPNGQNIPKRGKMAKAYRRSFVAPPGYFVLEADLSQAELRISASMASEPTMLKIYREGGDIHKETALIVLGISKARFAELPKDEQKSARQKAKAVNFGFIYGMGWRKFIGYAKTQYGVEFTEEEAQRIRDAFFRKYSRLTAWHERQRREAQQHGEVRSYSGRIRHLPMIYSDDEMIQQEAGRQSINSPVQEFASSLGVMAIGRLVQEIDPEYLAPIAFVHDAIFCYVKAEYLEWGAKTLKWYMETNPLEEWFGVRLPCPIVADVSFGLNFGDTFEMEGLTLEDPYDFTPVVTNDEGEEVIYVPEQIEPPNYGFLADLDK
jgi:uracil-DNA glycosylase family 4